MLPCWERASHSALQMYCRKMFYCALCIFFPTRCLCWDFKFNCIDSWSLYSYFTPDNVSTSYSLCKYFYHFVKHRPENKVLNLSLQNEMDVLAYFTLTVEFNFTVLIDKAPECCMFSKNSQSMLENYFSQKNVDQLSQIPKYINKVSPGVQVRRVT